jgi:hypothetical protein
MNMVRMKTETLSLNFAPVFSDFTEENGVSVPTRFQGVAYSGGLVRHHGAFGDTVIDLEQITIPKSLFMLVNHDGNQRAGRGRAWVENHQLLVEGSFSKATDSGQQVALECAEQAPWGLSVGVQSQPEFFASPKNLTVNGQSLTVKSVLRSPRLREISFVPVAADESATVISVFSQDNQESLVELTELQDRLASATALNAELTSQLSAAVDEKAQAVAALTAKLEAEAEQSKALLDRANALEAELSQFKSNVRQDAVKALFADLHRDYSDEAASPYLLMEDAVFAAVSSDLRSMKAPSLSEA